jgi:hypothetical protein
MKVFISWSGEASKAGAQALQQAIRDVFNGADPWMSAEDIKPGQQWFTELMATLGDTRFAIVCLTPRNLTSPWVMFEAGAVSGHFGEMKVAPLLLEGDLKELCDPIAAFQCTSFDKEGVCRLFGSINDSLGQPLTKKALAAAFELVWNDLDAAVRAALDRDRPTYDVFLSVPMASLESDAQYQPFRSDVLKVVRALRERCGLSVFCALEAIESIHDFDTYGVGAREDVEALEHSAHFVMIYPQRLASSALFEAGYALARGMPCRFFVRQLNELPFLMRKLAEVFTNVSIVDQTEWSDHDEIAERLEQNCRHWFGGRRHARLTD